LSDGKADQRAMPAESERATLFADQKCRHLMALGQF
jgi:hypothetical protein